MPQRKTIGFSILLGEHTMRNKAYVSGKQQQHEDGRAEMQAQVREFLARSKTDLKPNAARVRYNECYRKVVEVR
jgi:hypothetical protein